MNKLIGLILAMVLMCTNSFAVQTIGITKSLESPSGISGSHTVLKMEAIGFSASDTVGKMYTSVQRCLYFDKTSCDGSKTPLFCDRQSNLEISSFMDDLYGNLVDNEMDYVFGVYELNDTDRIGITKTIVTSTGASAGYFVIPFDRIRLTPSITKGKVDAVYYSCGYKDKVAFDTDKYVLECKKYIFEIDDPMDEIYTAFQATHIDYAADVTEVRE